MDRRYVRSTIETLECRCLLTAISFSGGTLLVTGTDAVNYVRVFPVGNKIKVRVKDAAAASTVTSFSRAAVKRISIFGGQGNDTLIVSTALVAKLIDVDAGPGNDAVLGGGGANTIRGGDGTDFLQGRDGNDVIYGGIGDDVIQPGLGTNIVYGGDGDDLIQGTKGNDQSYGEAGNDRIWSGGGTDRLDGGDGDDALFSIAASANTIVGGAGNDYAYHSATDDVRPDVEERFTEDL